jgi:hypothetical protein
MLEVVAGPARPAPVAVALLAVPALAPSAEAALLAPRPRLALEGLGGGALPRYALAPRRPSLALAARLAYAMALSVRLAPAMALPAGRRAAVLGAGFGLGGNWVVFLWRRRNGFAELGNELP